jgi:hypothetical protein
VLYFGIEQQEFAFTLQPDHFAVDSGAFDRNAWLGSQSAHHGCYAGFPQGQLYALNAGSLLDPALRAKFDDFPISLVSTGLDHAEPDQLLKFLTESPPRLPTPRDDKFLWSRLKEGSFIAKVSHDLKTDYRVRFVLRGLGDDVEEGSGVELFIWTERADIQAALWRHIEPWVSAPDDPEDNKEEFDALLEAPPAPLSKACNSVFYHLCYTSPNYVACSFAACQSTPSAASRQ